MKRRPKIVVIGGGTGVFTVLSGLRSYDADLSAIVTMADDGGSTGALREDFGMLPPGDIRRALVALSRSEDKLVSELFNYRFNEGSLAGHNFGNLMLAALERVTGGFEEALRAASRILGAEGEAIPVTLGKARLVAELENGKIVRGETNIDIPKHDGHLRIKKIFLEPRCSINPRAKAAILAANLIVIGPGDLYTSILPNMVVDGMTAALKKSRAKIAYVGNVMTKFGETNDFSASDFLKTIESYIGKDILDYVIANSKKPTPQRVRAYVAEKSFFVELDPEGFPKKPLLISASLIRAKGLVRHDPEKLAKLLWELI